MGIAPVGVVGGIIPELLEELPLEQIPAALQPCLSQFGRQGLQGLYVLRLIFHQGGIVCYQGGNESVICSVLPLLITAVDKKPFDITVTDTAGVAGVVTAFRQAVGLTHRQVDLADPVLFELGSLVKKQYIVLCALVLIQVAVTVAVTKPNCGPSHEAEYLFRLVVLGKGCRQHGQKRLYMVVQQFPVCLSQNQHPDTGPGQAQKHCLYPHRPAFAAAPGATVSHMAVGIR